MDFEVPLGRRMRLAVKVMHSAAGQRVFVFETDQGRHRIAVQEHLLDGLRRTFLAFTDSLGVNGSNSGDETIITRVFSSFGGQHFFRLDFERDPDHGEVISVLDLQSTETSDRLVVPVEYARIFSGALFDDRLGFPSGCLEKVMSYHSLLQLAFPNVSASLNASMGHRNGFLTIEINAPRLSEPIYSLQHGDDDDTSASDESDGRAKSLSKRNKPSSFKSRLGVRTRSALSVSYDELLSSLGVGSRSDESTSDKDAGAVRKLDALPSAILDLGIQASQVHALATSSIRIKVEEDDMEALRLSLETNGGGGEFFLGFEIVDVWYLDRVKKVKAVRFPLYFLPVTVVDYGAEIEVCFAQDPVFNLNFLAISDLAQRFSGARATDKFLEDLLGRIQMARFDFLGKVERVRIERRLPVDGSLLLSQRRVLLGQEDRGPIGGALEGLRIQHVTIDPGRTLLFPRNLSMTEADLALASDLDRIRKQALAGTQEFNATLLGHVFNPSRPAVLEIGKRKRVLAQAGEAPRCNPFDLPDALRFLFDEFERKDLILVEGPPGTGKTFSMLNLLVHCVCSGKRVLVVSDKQSALDALFEKIAEFMRDGVADDREHLTRDLALRAGIKRPIWSERSLTGIQSAARALRTELKLDLVQEILVSGRVSGDSSVADQARFEAELGQIDVRIKDEIGSIDRLLSKQFGPEVHGDKRVCSRHSHETTADEIRDLADFCSYLLTSPDLPLSELKDCLRTFVRNRREILFALYPGIASDFCPVDFRGWKNQEARLKAAGQVIETMLIDKPLTLAGVEQIAKPLGGTRWPAFLASLHARVFTSASGSGPTGLRRIRDRFFFPLAEDLQNLLSVIRDDLELFRCEGLTKRRCVSQLAKLHQFLTCQTDQIQTDLQHKRMPGQVSPAPCLAWAIVSQIIYESFAQSRAAGERADQRRSQDKFEHLTADEIGARLHGIQTLQSLRSSLVRRRFTSELLSYFHKQVEPGPGRDPLATSKDLVADLDSQFERVVKADNVSMAIQSFEGLKRAIARCFPVWLLLKEHVSLALPMSQGLFDVVIIDESTQCRVDDAIPLLYRAKKVIAVGDENQTVLQRTSVVDDFLFDNFELESHLHTLGATAVKAAGSHFFGLLKGLKQSRVLLDEHFRCPPEVIEYSNKYVYDGLLKVMKWRPQGSADPVVVDHSERRTRNRNRPTSGKFKGIEIGMIDRFFGWVEQSILDFEQETGRRINLEQDVAICYFLLKNEDYIKQRKVEFIRSMRRGADVLDGAGAALQGKERDLIFFLWDVTRGNLQAFMQGDDPTKRKGELNVLMSRPRLRAYHFLHKDFGTLDHERSSITHYLWSAYKAREHSSAAAPNDLGDDSNGGVFPPSWVVRQTRPGAGRLPWRRSDGQLVFELLRVVCSKHGLGGELAQFVPQFGVVIGRPEHRVDLVLSPIKGRPGIRIAVVELSGFESLAHGGELHAYAAILSRASPAVESVFLHIHELFARDGFAINRIFQLLQLRSAA
jgi:hypothetical protein